MEVCVTMAALQSPPLPSTDAARLRALAEYAILDTDHEDSFDQLAVLAARLCSAPMAVVNFLDAERQWFKAAVGVPMRETPRAVAFCDHALRNPHQPTVVEDATRHPLFATYPSVVGEPHIRFYACIPLVTDEGHALGTLAVMDTRCRGLAAEELQALQMLARQTMDQLELRRQKLQLSLALQEREQMRAALQAQNNVLQAAGRVARLGGWVMELPSRAFTLSSGIASTFGMRRAEESTSEDRPATYALDEVLKAFQPPLSRTDAAGLC